MRTNGKMLVTGVYGEMPGIKHSPITLDTVSKHREYQGHIYWMGEQGVPGIDEHGVPGIDEHGVPGMGEHGVPWNV